MAGVLFGVFLLFFLSLSKGYSRTKAERGQTRKRSGRGREKESSVLFPSPPPPSFSRFNLTVSRGVNVWRVRRRNKVTVSRGLTIQA